MKIIERDEFFICQFEAMASPCEIFFKEKKSTKASALANLLIAEVYRLEKKYSRYQSESVISQINQAQGKRISIDQETYQLLHFAKQCYAISEGNFDITTGVLRHLWKEAHIPTQQEVEAFRSRVGFEKIHFSDGYIQMLEGVEIDFGGLVKEYAVDKVSAILRTQNKEPFLVNLGGDLFSDGKEQHVWKVGVESAQALGEPSLLIDFIKGGLATSGSTRRYLEIEGKRFGHILSPKTLFPVEGAPLSVSVLASSCSEAGFLATFAMLKGSKAEAFLKKEGYKAWVQR